MQSIHGMLEWRCGGSSFVRVFAVLGGFNTAKHVRKFLRDFCTMGSKNRQFPNLYYLLESFVMVAAGRPRRAARYPPKLQSGEDEATTQGSALLSLQRGKEMQTWWMLLSI